MSTSATIPIPQGAAVGSPAQSAAMAIPSGASIGHPEEGITYNGDGSFVITPKDGESFSDTMNRAAQIGKSVSPDTISAQTRKGVSQVPTVLGAASLAGPATLAPVLLGAGGTAMVPAGAGFAGSQLVQRATPSLASQAIERFGPQALKVGAGALGLKGALTLYQLLKGAL